MGSLSIAHLGLVLVAAFLLLGRGKFSAAMRDFGRGLKNFRNAMADNSPPIGLGQTAHQDAEPLTGPGSASPPKS